MCFKIVAKVRNYVQSSVPIIKHSCLAYERILNNKDTYLHNKKMGSSFSTQANTVYYTYVDGNHVAIDNNTMYTHFENFVKKDCDVTDGAYVPMNILISAYAAYIRALYPTKNAESPLEFAQYNLLPLLKRFCKENECMIELSPGWVSDYMKCDTRVVIGLSVKRFTLHWSKT